MTTIDTSLSAEKLRLQHNELAVKLGRPGCQIKAPWKKAKSVLIEQIEKLAEEQRLNEEEDARMAKIAEEALSKKPKASKPAKAKKSGKKPTIRELCLRYLVMVDFYEDRETGEVVDSSAGRSVGYSYDALIEMIRKEEPTAKTSVACLRWYAVKVRAEEAGYEGYTLPQRRPRNSMKK